MTDAERQTDTKSISNYRSGQVHADTTSWVLIFITKHTEGICQKIVVSDHEAQALCQVHMAITNIHVL